jgi:Lrp/AsnC family transcriptional regulator, leucine-responsive regulatory protein
MAFDTEKILDDISWRILEELQTDARLSMAELGRRIGLSAPATAERVRRLEDAGVIAGYRAQVNVRRAGRPLLAFVRISAYGDVKKRVSEMVQITPEVMEAHRGTGSDCFILKLAVRDIAHLEQITDKFTSFGQLTTSIVLSSPLEDRTVERIDLEMD